MTSRDCSITVRCCGVAWMKSSASAIRCVIICFIMNRPPRPCAHAAPAAIKSANAPTPMRIFFTIVFLLGDGVRSALCGAVAAVFRSVANPFLQILAGAQGLLDARAGIADHQFRRLSGERLRQVCVPAGELHPHLVGNLRQRALALVVALADQPLPEELLVEHLLVLAAAKALLA